MFTEKKTKKKCWTDGKEVFEEISKLHGVPARIVLDHDLRFISEFWKGLNKQLRTKVHLSTVYHLHTGGTYCEPAYWIVGVGGLSNILILIFFHTRIATKLVSGCLHSKYYMWVLTELPSVGKHIWIHSWRIGLFEDRHYWATLTSKIISRFMGLYKILKGIGLDSYKIELSMSMVEFYKAFHISVLKKGIRNK